MRLHSVRYSDLPPLRISKQMRYDMALKWPETEYYHNTLIEKKITFHLCLRIMTFKATQQQVRGICRGQLNCKLFLKSMFICEYQTFQLWLKRFKMKKIKRNLGGELHLGESIMFSYYAMCHDLAFINLLALTFNLFFCSRPLILTFWP